MKGDLKVKPDWMTDEEWERELKHRRLCRHVTILSYINIVGGIFLIILAVRRLLL